jgi:hypothetical protein
MTLAPARLRPFGRAQDLELDFADEDRPALVTTLLAGCDAACDAEFWWAQTVGARTAALLRVLALTEEKTSELPVRLVCGEPQCGEPLEVALPIDALLAAAPDDEGEAGLVAIPLPDARSVALRRPTGRDLRAWHRAPHATRRDAVAAMLDTLLVEGSLTSDDEPVVADAMAAHDPLVAFAVSCACPACGAACDHPVDLEAAVLARLGARRRTLLREVHMLASRYGWTESEVLAVAPARRAQYLALIEDGP